MSGAGLRAGSVYRGISDEPRKLAGGAALEDNPVAQSVIMLAEREQFLGTASELLTRLKAYIRELV